jgi:Ciliary basal body-associated, B9 protein
MQQFRSWIAGAYPEFFDSKFVTRSEAREVTRVQRRGRVRVTLNVMCRLVALILTVATVVVYAGSAMIALYYVAVVLQRITVMN